MITSGHQHLSREGRRGVGAALLALCLAPSLAFAQGEAPPKEGPALEQGPALQRIWVPRKAFTKILARHPGGVMLREAELEALVKRAQAQRAAGRVPIAVDAPRLATLEALSYTGTLEGETVTLEARARVAVQGTRTSIRLPLRGIGLTGVWVEDQPAQVVIGDRGPVVLLPGSAVPVTREVRWQFALRVKVPAKRAEAGAGQIAFPIPPAASASLSLVLPGEIEPLVGSGSVGTRWVEPVSGGTRLRVAFGGGRGGTERLLELGWRPRRALNAAKPYVSAREQTLFTIRRGLTSLRSRIDLSVFRAPRDRFQFLLPPGFVVRELTSPQGKPNYLQRERRVEVQWPTPRQGLLTIEISAERPSVGEGSGKGKEAEWQGVGASAIRVLDVDRSGGVFAIAAGPDTAILFPALNDKASASYARLERADLGAFDAAQVPPAADAGLVRVYRHINGLGSVSVLQRRLAPQIALGIQAVVQVEARELKALAFYRYSVEAGAVYAVRAQLPPGFSLEDSLVRDERGRRPEHRLSERVRPDGSVELLIELEEGLRAPSELLLTLQCAREVPQGVTKAPLAIPRFLGTPRTELRGLFGFASDPTFRLSGRDLQGLLAIPAADLPRAGLEAEGLALGYRVEGIGYQGQLSVTRRETRLSVEQVEHHTVGERLLSSQFSLDLEVSGAPVQSLDLWLPEGSGGLASIRGEGLLRERDQVEVKEGRARWRLSFRAPWSGRRALRVEFQTPLATPSSEAASEVDLPQVSVARAFRERGTLAVFSSGEAELVATPRGLRPLEVTEAPALVAKAGPSSSSPDTKRPIFAYRWVRLDHGLTLGVSRPGLTPVLSAVAEHLHLATSAAADGTARHMARFTVKNLDNQFFGLVLPEGATLWSVAVNGEGVKPAAREGVLLVPIPNAGKNAGQGTVIQATYTQATSAWGWLGEADLQAPALTFGTSAEDRVPILRTTWALSLPEDVRALEVAGNLQGATQRSFVEPLLRRGWRSWRHESWPWWALGLGLPALLIVVTGRGRKALFSVAHRTYRAGGSCRSVAVELPWLRIAKVTGVVLAVLIMTGLCLSGLASLGSSSMRSAPAAKQSRLAAERAQKVDYTAQDKALSRSVKKDRGGALPYEYAGGDSSLPLSPAASAPAPAPHRGRKGRAQEKLGSKFRSDEQDKFAEKEHAKRPAKKRRENGRRRPVPKSAPPPPAKPSGARPEAGPKILDGLTQVDPPSIQLDTGKDDDGEDDDEGSSYETPDEERSLKTESRRGFEPPMDSPAEVGAGRDEKKVEEKQKNLEGTSVTDAYGVGGGAAGAYGQRWGKLPPRSETATPDLAAALNAESGGIKGGVPVARISEMSAGGEVGLRSLVLELGAVGEDSAFHRSGGGAILRLSLASERLFLVLGGLFALFGFLGALGVPASRRWSGLTLVVAGLAVTTLVPLIWAGALVGALANALTLGLLSAAPVLFVGALARGWQTRPLGRLLAALRAA